MATKKKTFYPLMDDVMARLFFSDSRNIKYIKHFIKSITDFSYEELEGMAIINSKLTRNNINTKALESDIKIKLSNGSIIIIEFQNNNDRESERKNISYGMNEIIIQIKRGENYDKISPVYQIIVVNNDTVRKKSERKLLSECQIRDKDNKELILTEDIYKVKMLDINCEDEYDKISNELKSWLKLFRSDTPEKLKENIKGDKIAIEVSKIMEVYMRNTLVRTLADKIEDSKRIEVNMAREERTYQIVENLIKLKTPIETISLSSGLTKEEIKEKFNYKEEKNNEEEIWVRTLKEKEEAKKEGIKEGRKEEKYQIVENLIKLKTPIETISLSSGLTKEEIKEKFNYKEEKNNEEEIWVRTLKEKEEAKKEGIKEGISIKVYEMVKVMHCNNEPIDKISLYTNLSKEEILDIIGVSYDLSLSLTKNKPKKTVLREEKSVYNKEFLDNLENKNLEEVSK